jgi:Flp pilus assembly protein TadD
MYFQTALVARPEASDALAGLCLVSILKGEKPDAIKYATASRDAAPDVAIGHFALAAALAVSGRSAEARTELDLAAKLDPISLGSRGIPNAAQVWNYLEIGGRIPVLAMPQ